MIKLKKQPSESDTYSIDFTDELASGEILSTLTSVLAIPIGTTADDETIDLTLTNKKINDSIINGTIAVGKAVQFDIAAGLSGYEYIITAKVVTSVGSRNLEADVVLLVVDSISIPLDYYGNILRATEYFTNRLFTDSWVDSDNPTQRKALIHASQAIDRLNYKGTKTDDDQVLSFPRDDDTEVPTDIEFATYELALRLLDGIDPLMEEQGLVVSSSRYASVSTTFDRSKHSQEHVLAGIPSIVAWNYLRPYLRDPRQISLSRIS